MHRLITFKADAGEILKYRQTVGADRGSCFYRIANVGSVPSLIKTIAEHYCSSGKPAPELGDRLTETYCSSGKPAPELGDRLTETIPENRDSFRDSGWEVIRVERYSSEINPPHGNEFDEIYICYCAYKPLSSQDQWTKQSHRLPVSVDSFGGDREAYDEWLQSQKQPAIV
jgi:hypothetical protein